MAREIKVNIVGDSRGYQKALGSATKSTEGMSKTFTKLGRLAVIGLGAAGVAAGVAGVKMIGLASDAEEVDSKFKIVFGKTMPRLTKQIDAFSEATGASRYELRQQVADMGALLKPIIGNTKETGKMSVAVAQLATDLSSFNNVPVEEALLSIRSGLVGEAEPLRKFGVLLNEAAVQAEGVRLGLVKQDEQMTEGEKVQARYSLIMQQTALAQGDAKRTSGSFANQLRRLQNKVKDVGTDIGKKLLPFVTAAVGLFNDAFTAVDRFARRLSRAEGFKAKFNIAFTGIKGAAQDVWDKLADAITGTSQATPLKLKSGKIIEWEAPAAGLATQIQQGIKDVDWGSVGKTIGENITSKVKVTAEFLGSMLEAANKWIDQHVSQIGELGAKILGNIVLALTDPVFWAKNWDLILLLIVSKFPGGKQLGKLGIRMGGALMRPFFEAVGRLLGRMPGLFKVALTVVGQGIAAFARKAWDDMLETFGKLPGLLQRAFKLTAILVFFNTVKNIFNAIKGAVSSMVEWIRKKLGQIPGLAQPVRAAFFTILGPIQLIIAAVQRLIDWIGRIPSPGSVLGGLGDAVRGVVPGLASGGTIARSGMAIVHRGEQVVPARVVNRGGTSNGGGRMQLALVAVGPDILRELRELERRGRMGGSLA